MTDHTETALELLLDELRRWLDGPAQADVAMLHRLRIAAVLFAIGEYPVRPAHEERRWLREHGVRCVGEMSENDLARWNREVPDAP